MNELVSNIRLNKSTPPGFATLARRLVLGRLNGIHTGCLVIIQGTEIYSFGQSLAPETDLYAELIVHDPRCYTDIVTGGSLGAAESYMSGDWTSPDLTKLVRVMVRNTDVLDRMEGSLAGLSRPLLKFFHERKRNTERGARRNVAAHYDLGNEFFRLFLDPKMMYSSAIFPDETATLEQASVNKLDCICRKLQLKENDHVLEIGSGWGGFAIHAARHYGCRVTTTTISAEQYRLAADRIRAAGLEDRITLLQEDYRHIRGRFDKLVSIEMIEAVGWQYYDDFYRKCASLLKSDGLMLVQAITIADQRYERARRSVDFIQRYVFPGSCIPSQHALLTAMMRASDLRLIHTEDFAGHYARTLRAWNDRFHENIDQVRALGYSDEFLRMWEFYLSYCEGGFAERAIGVAHLLYAGPRFRGG
jgi:cyclopropane-fatty-acyl-phospholipid synthase